ncbi:MAG: DnaJ domain-containing protein [Bacteroidales bacterium]
MAKHTYGKWIAGAIGWALGGPIGALLGFGLGSMLDDAGGNNNFSASNSAFNNTRGQRNSFLISLLVLSSAVMKADGKVKKSELEYVKRFIRTNFGENAIQESLYLLKDLLAKEVNIEDVSAQIVFNTSLESRFQLLHYLCGIAVADKAFSIKERELLKKIAVNLHIQASDAESILSMYGSTSEDAYKILGISSDASDEEVKKAYKKMAIKHHPDKVASLGPDIRKAAEEKFKTIAKAYEDIKKERGLK